MLFYLLVLGVLGTSCKTFSFYFESQSERPRVSKQRFTHCLFASRVADCLVTSVLLSSVAGIVLNTLPVVTIVYGGLTLVFTVYASVKEMFDRAKMAHETK